MINRTEIFIWRNKDIQVAFSEPFGTDSMNNVGCGIPRRVQRASAEGVGGVLQNDKSYRNIHLP